VPSIGNFYKRWNVVFKKEEVSLYTVHTLAVAVKDLTIFFWLGQTVSGMPKPVI